LSPNELDVIFSFNFLSAAGGLKLKFATWIENTFIKKIDFRSAEAFIPACSLMQYLLHHVILTRTIIFILFVCIPRFQ